MTQHVYLLADIASGKRPVSHDERGAAGPACMLDASLASHTAPQRA
ncbi:hypothetical protein BCAR13_420055 [Paraburkholderia caribensis]|nr:hypothetical protein BCAR13_420055 [Paraburkholderia caribensis]